MALTSHTARVQGRDVKGNITALDTNASARTVTRKELGGIIPALNSVAGRT